MTEEQIALRREGEPQPAHDPELTLADDCAALLEAWFQQRAMCHRVLLMESEVKSIANKMRALASARRAMP